MKHMATAIVPKIYDAGIADEDLGIATEESHKMVRRLAREEGLLVGISSGAAMAVVLKVAAGLRKSKHAPGGPEGPLATIVTIFPDGGDKYLSERFWEDD